MFVLRNWSHPSKHHITHTYYYKIDGTVLPPNPVLTLTFYQHYFKYFKSVGNYVKICISKRHWICVKDLPLRNFKVPQKMQFKVMKMQGFKKKILVNLTVVGSGSPRLRTTFGCGIFLTKQASCVHFIAKV